MKHILIAFCLMTIPALADTEADKVKKCLVHIRNFAQPADYYAPWREGGRRGGTGTGFIIDGNLIMTNAHVVSDSTFLSVRREGSAQAYNARIKHIAHDCDLALLAVEDESFFEGSQPLPFGGIPKIKSTVFTYGYPVGGKAMSVTKGIVSRIEFNTYSHSGLDSHLTVQTDAAINPGNSGGPIIQDAKIVGVAFQGYRANVAQSTGYMIPIPVVKRMLQDVKDGKYDGYVELGLEHMNLENQALRAYLKLPEDRYGVLVTDVMAQSSSSEKIKEGDVLRKIDGHFIDMRGQIKLDNEMVELEEIVERKFSGDKVIFEILRDGKEQSVTVTLKSAPPFRIYSRRYEEKPEYLMFAGLLFQPVSANMMAAHKINNPDISHFYNFYVQDEIFVERPQLIVLSRVIPDPINSDLRSFQHRLVEEVNDVKIRKMEDLQKAFAKDVKHHVIKLYSQGRPIVIDAAKVKAAEARIAQRYGIKSFQFIRTGGEK